MTHVMCRSHAAIVVFLGLFTRDALRLGFASVAPGRGSSLIACSILLSTKRPLVRDTVEPLTPTLAAISSSRGAASAVRRTWTREQGPSRHHPRNDLGEDGVWLHLD